MSVPLVVIGDTLLDRDVDGKVQRLCPDAPVPVLDEQGRTERPGGAGLAALLAAADGSDVVLVTALADDAAAARLTDLLAAAGVRVCPLSVSGSTVEKIRLRAGGQTLLRLDRGGTAEPVGEPPEAALKMLSEASAILGARRHPPARAAARYRPDLRTSGMGPASARSGRRAGHPTTDPERGGTAPARRRRRRRVRR